MSERIKNLSTAKTQKAEAKGKDKVEGDFFGKFILCSNNEDNFIKIDINPTTIKYTSDKYLYIRKGVYKLRYCYLNVLNSLIYKL